MTNLLKNPNFDMGVPEDGTRNYAMVVTPDGRYLSTERGEVNRPLHWGVWYRHDQSPPEHDPDNDIGWAEPEVGVATYPERYEFGTSAQKMFTTFRIHEGGYYQRVQVPTGSKVRASFRCHAWSGNSHDPLTSEGVGQGPFSALEGETDHTQAIFRVGIDPTGGDDPESENIVWGIGAHIYNANDTVPFVQVEAQGSYVTVFTKGRFLWRFAHNDAYVDTATLEVVEENYVPPIDVDYDYPVVDRGSKLHPHAIAGSGTYDLLKALNDVGQPLPFVKLLATSPQDLETVRDFKRVSPSTKIVARVMRAPVGYEHINIEGPNFDVHAGEYMEAMLIMMRQYPDVDYWELINEQNPPDKRPMIRWFEECQDIAHAEGFKLALFSFSSGVPEFEDWQMMFESSNVFQKAKEHGDILSLHAYSRTADETETAYHLLRPTRLYNEILIPNNCVVPYIHTEYGISETAPRVGIEDWSTEDLMEEYRLVDRMVAEQYYCLGLSIYTFGGASSWTWYNHDPIWRDVRDLILSEADRQNALPETTPDPPSEKWFPPRVSYDKTTVLLPPPADASWAVAVANATWDEKRWVVGSSADDAGMGPPNRTVVAVNPDQWPGDLEAFFVTHYPGVEYLPIEADTPEQLELLLRGTDDPWDVNLSEDLPRRYNLSRWPDGRWPHRNTKDINRITVHHIGSLVSDLHAHAQAYLYKDSTGRPAYPYTFVIERDGTIKKCLNLDEANWHDHSGNHVRHLSIGLNGALHVYPPTEEQYKSLVKLVNWAVDSPHMSIDMDRINGHMDYIGTVCPGWNSASSGYWKPRFFEKLNGIPPKPSPPVASKRAVHGPPIFSAPQDIGSFVSRLSEMRIGIYKMLDYGDSRMPEFVSALRNAGIEPVVRLWRGHHLPEHVPDVENVARLGDNLKIEVINEPNLSVEWRDGYFTDWRDDNLVARIGDVWFQAASKVVSLGGQAGLPAMAPTDRGGVNWIFSSQMFSERLIAYLNSKHGSTIRSWNSNGRLWLSVHTAAMGRPFDYDPQRSWGWDDMCLKGYERMQALSFDAFGEMPVISTEGGVFSPYHMYQLGWTSDPEVVYFDGTNDVFYTDETWGERVLESFAVSEIPLCHWHFTDEGVHDQMWWQNGWHDRNGIPRSPAIVLRG